jgi:hypothetical protein
MSRKVMIYITVLMFVVLLMNLVNAGFWACFNKGQLIDFCSSKVPDRTSPSDGYSVCMSNYNQTRNCYVQGNPNACNKKNSCTWGNATVDSDAPNLTINSPFQGQLCTSRTNLLDFGVNERATVYYFDNIRGKRWIKLCPSCPPGPSSYSRKKSFKEGFNNFTFRVVDVMKLFKNLFFLLIAENLEFIEQIQEEVMQMEYLKYNIVKIV